MALILDRKVQRLPVVVSLVIELYGALKKTEAFRGFCFLVKRYKLTGDIEVINFPVLVFCMRIFLKHGVIFLSSVVLTVATIVVPNNLVQNKENARMVWYGFPLEFVAQDFSDIAEKSFYPRYINFFENWESIDIVDYSIGRFLVSALVFFGLFEMVVFLLERLKALVLYIREQHMKK